MAYYSEKKLYKTQRGAIFGGICSGISEYIQMDVTIVRAIFILFGLMFGSAIPLYIILWIILPKN